MNKGQKVTEQENKALALSKCQMMSLPQQWLHRILNSESSQEMYFFINCTSFCQALTMCRHLTSRIEQLTK